MPGDFCDLHISLSTDHAIKSITPVTVGEVPRKTIIALSESDSRLARALWWSNGVAEAIQREWIVNLGQSDVNSVGRVKNLSGFGKGICSFLGR